jgi:hypothetical protein
MPSIVADDHSLFGNKIRQEKKMMLYRLGGTGVKSHCNGLCQEKKRAVMA